MYRSSWLIVVFPLLLAVLALSRPGPLPAPSLPPTFDRRSAEAFAVDLAGTYPDRSPGSAAALGAESWFSDQMQRYGYMVASPANKCPTSEFRTERFFATVAGAGRLPFVNQFAIAHGVSTDTIVVMAHRDDAGTGPGANDNASGTGALMELARAYVNPACRAVQPAHTIVFLSSDGGIYGAVGGRSHRSSRARGCK